jgi:hypothetical protein
MVKNTPVLAFHNWTNNGSLVADVARLGYLQGRVCDLTWGLGNFWSVYRPASLTTNDIDPSTSAEFHHDFCKPPVEWHGMFDSVVADPPYRLRGRPDPHFDTRYGTNSRSTEAEIMGLIHRCIVGAGRCVQPKGYLLVKLADQVVSGRVVWQTLDAICWARQEGFKLVDRFDMIGGRPQPPGRRQIHARRNASSLLVFTH